jgi:formamidopyrimidine-DNA glycosylase
MPELPEVETMARDIRPHLVGARLVRLRVLKPDVLRRVRRPRFERALAGRRVVSVGRRAKHLVIALDDGHRVVIQPGMTGSVQVLGRSVPDPYAVIEADLSTRRRFRYRDVRRIGRVYLLSARQWTRYDASWGPEPLAPDFTAESLARVLAGGRLAVKKAIMDQRRLAGVGNIYAGEALWLAGIDPSKEARRLSTPQMAALRDAIVDVLRRSIAGRGTTVRDYRTGTGEPGTFQRRLAVYERAGRPCPRCGRRIVLTHAIDARSTYFCPGCQR